MSDVIVAVYDLSQGMAAQFSAGILGRRIDGIWHTAVIAYGREYYFGGGICADVPGSTPYGQPVKTYPLGRTQKTSDEFLAFLQSVSPQFSMHTYDLFSNNCNNFSDACAMFLVQRHIPQYILDLPNEALNSPMGPMLRSMMDNMQSTIRDQSAGHELQLGANPTGTASAPPSRKHSTAHLWGSPALLTNSKRSVVVAKLREFSPDATGAEDVAALVALAMAQPPRFAFPALDLLRLACTTSVAEGEALARALPILLGRFCEDTGDEARPSFMMAVRAAVNCFKHASVTKFILSDKECRAAALTSSVAAIGHAHKSVRVAGSALALNLAGAHERDGASVPALTFDDAALLLSALCNVLQPEAELQHADVARYIIPALAVLIDADEDALQMAQVFGADVKRYADASAGFNSTTQKAAALADEKISAVR